MKTTIRKMGNSHGVIIPKPLLAQVGLQDEVDMVIEKDRIVLRRPKSNAREGWAAASQRIATAGDDALVWPDVPNQGDAELQW